MSSFLHRHYHRHYHGVYNNPKKLFIFDLVLLGIATLMLGSSLFFFFWKPGITDLIDLKISLGDTRLKSGDEVILTIDYTNRSKKYLKQPTLALRLPPGFIIDRTKTPESVFSKNSIFALEDLHPGASGQVGVSGQYWAMPGQEERIFATLSYQVENDSEREQKLGAYLATLPESVLATNFTTAASSSFPNFPLAFTFKIKNTSASAISGISILTEGAKATFADNTPLKNITLQSGEEISLNGTLLSPTTPGEQTASFTTQVLANNNPITQSKNPTTFSVIAPSLTTSVSTNNTLDYIEPGQILPIQIAWKNNTPFALKNLRLRLKANPGLINLKTTATENKLKIIDGDLIIDSDARTAFANGAASQGEEFSLNLTLAPNFNAVDKSQTELRLTTVIEAESDQVAGQVFASKGADLILPLATDLTLNTQVRYYTADGDQLGRGALPPRVGETTKYWVFIEALNTINPIEDTALTIQLPSGVIPTGKQSVTLGSPLKWNETNRTLTWNILDIPAQSKTGWYFEVAVTPTASDVGKNLTLLNNVNFVASDKKVHKKFNLGVAQLTNVLKANDRGAKSGAKVVSN